MILWATPTSISGEGYYPLPGDVARLEITAHPAFLSSSTATLPRYRGLGQLGFTVGGLPTETTAIGYLDTFLGPFPNSADGLYILLSAGVTANLYRGYEMSELNQPAAILGLSSAVTLVNTTGQTITWTTIEQSVGQMPKVADLRKMHIYAGGLYLVNAYISLPQATYTDLYCALTGAAIGTLVLGRGLADVAPAVGYQINLSRLVPLQAGDEVSLFISQTSGADRALDTTSKYQLVRVANL